jgi:4-hydroxybutyrate dehydrogenase/sulfolactaldehyde 3-reductase
MAVVGLIGAGPMGTACTQRLLAKGFEVLAFDVDPTKLAAIAKLGARTAASTVEIALKANSVVLAVLNTDQVDEGWPISRMRRVRLSKTRRLPQCQTEANP